MVVLKFCAGEEMQQHKPWLTSQACLVCSPHLQDIQSSNAPTSSCSSNTAWTLLALSMSAAAAGASLGPWYSLGLYVMELSHL